MKADGFGRLVGNVVFVPTGIAYLWAMLGYVLAGLGLYLFFMAGALKIQLFEQLREWPIISKSTLAAGPILMALGCYFSTIKTDYYMLLPMFAYTALSIAAWHALASRFDR
jgi:hypothetical protein